MKKRTMFYKMIFSSILRRKSRMFIALLAIAIGATILSGLVTIYYDIPRQLGKEFRSYGANVAILPSGDNLIALDKIDTLKTSIGTDRIVGLAPYRYHTTKVNEQPYVLTGTDLEQAKNNSPFWYIEGRWLTNDEADKVMIGEAIADKLDLGVGDSIRVKGVKYEEQATASGITMSAEENEKRDQSDNNFDHKYEIVGIVTTGGAEEEFIFLPIDELNTLINGGNYADMIEGSIEANQQELDQLSARIGAENDSLVMRPVRRVTQSQDQVLSKLQALVYIVTIIVLIITMISVTTTMMAMVLERKQEIGLKKALGAENNLIVREFIAESMILGVFGGALGVILGFEFAKEVSLSVFGRAINFQFYLIPITIAVSALISALASVWPIRKILDIHPAIVLKGE